MPHRPSQRRRRPGPCPCATLRCGAQLLGSLLLPRRERAERLVVQRACWTHVSSIGLRRPFASALFGLSGLALVASAHAQASDPALAEALFQQARAEMSAGDYAGACPKFKESYRLDPATG